MNHAKVAVSSVMVVVLLVLSFFLLISNSTASETTQSKTQAPAGCIIDVSGTLGLVVCGGKVVDKLNLPTVTVQGPKITLPPVTVEVPGPRGPETTVTVRPPAETTTVRPPAETVTVRPAPETTTVTTSPSPRPTPAPAPTVTVTQTPTGQPEVEDDTILAPTPRATPSFDLGDGKTTFVEVGLGLLAILGIISLAIISMYLGYVLGWKDKERKETRFIRALLEKSALNK